MKSLLFLNWKNKRSLPVKKRINPQKKEKPISIHKLYERVVGIGGISPSYFLDRMTFGEVEMFLTGFNLRNREAWEQTRIIGYIIAQSNSTKKLEQTDILRFPWDEEDKEAATVTDDEIKRLREKAKQVEQMYKN